VLGSPPKVRHVIATRGRPYALAVFGAWVANCYRFLMLALAGIYLPLLFPDRRLLSRRWTLGIVLLRALMDTIPVWEVPGQGIEGLDKPGDLPLFGALTGLFLAIRTTEGNFDTTPSADDRLRVGDTLIVLGSRGQIERLEQLMRGKEVAKDA
jgi:hypothetical protein